MGFDIPFLNFSRNTHNGSARPNTQARFLSILTPRYHPRHPPTDLFSQKITQFV
jgi:hypothetical protein